MGEVVRIDDRWRIVIPAKFRKGLRPRDKLIVEKRGGEIVLRKAPRRDLLEEFRKIKLVVSEELRNLGAEKGKHKYGGYKE